MLRDFIFLYFCFLFTIYSPITLSDYVPNSLMCDRDNDRVNDLIKDTIAQGLDHTIVPNLRAFCTIRNEGDYGDLPLSMTVSRANDAWIARLTYESTDKMYIERVKARNNSDDSSPEIVFNRYWIMYKLARKPYTCNSCRIGVYFNFNDTQLDGTYSVKYGFQIVVFPGLIDYSLPETIRREDKSNYAGVNKTFTSSQENTTVHLDDNFIGEGYQNFLAGISDQPDPIPVSSAEIVERSRLISFLADILPPFIRKRFIKPDRTTSTEILSINQVLDIRIDNTLKGKSSHGHDPISNEKNAVDMDQILHEARVLTELSPRIDSENQSDDSLPAKLVEEFLNLEKLPTISVAYCYTYDPDVDSAKRVYTTSRMCYPYIDADEASECICWKNTSLKKYFLIVLTILVISLIGLIALKKQKFPPKINRVDISSRDENPQNLVKIKVTCGHLTKLKLPGFLDLDFKKADGSPLYHVRITHRPKWTCTKVMSNDVSELIVNYKTNAPIVKPRFLEVTLFRSVPNEPLVYLYGVEYAIENIHTLNETFPYGHYLDNRRTVRLSNAADWRRALTRINLTTNLPITSQSVRSITILERLIYTLPVIYGLGPRIFISINRKNLDTIAQGLPSAFSMEANPLVMAVAYIVLWKKNYSDRYHLIPLSINHKLFTFFTVVFLLIIGSSYFTFLFQFIGLVWTGGKFNAEIARKYSDVQRMKDLSWILTMSVGILFSHLLLFIIERIAFKLNRPTQRGPVTFDIGYEVPMEPEEQLPTGSGLVNRLIMS